MNYGFHPFHIVSISPWPILCSFSIMSFVINSLYYMNKFLTLDLLLESLLSLILVIFCWWRDVIRESTFQGFHMKKVCFGLYMGVSMFIISEVMFFFSFFFGYFFSSLVPDVEIGCSWPPVGVQSLSFMDVPLLNTMILLSSGISITWSHHSLLENNFTNCLLGMIFTVILGLIFTFFQFMEYLECSFSMADSVYGSLFYISTGFHGIHVIVGTLFIIVSFIRMMKYHFSIHHHLGFEFSIWYWHFVDVVWLFLFLSVYYL
uniref:Cytochrome c oxidase subunit 3 n=1 Tax=Ibidoecus bisignatus TaxID=236520 RepID=G1EN79_9NEOP|nr:cytochrome c oxidase subunit III [Ibidoecus bisignatus]AEM23862.1 cytochrome c oxidase subunit III [Ibidoecus bisignatus]UTT72608.1 cytochrome c oxidase subunit 3 [Ibidoecus bisignatus]